MNFSLESKTGSNTRLFNPAVFPAVIAFAVCLVLGLSAVAWSAKAGANTAHIRAQTEAVALGAAIELQFSKALRAGEVLGVLVQQNGGALPEFQTVAGELHATYPELASLELQPGGVVKEIVPRTGNERGFGLNVFKDPVQRGSAAAAVQNRRSTLSAPLALYDGQPGLVVRVPVFQRTRDGHGDFWGFVVVSMRLPGVLQRAGLDELHNKGYNYALFAPGSGPGKAILIAGRGTSALKSVVRQSVRAQNLELQLALQPRSGWVNNTKIMLESAGVLLASGLLFLLVNVLVSRRHIQSTLQDSNRLLGIETSDRKRAQEEVVRLRPILETTQRELTEARTALQDSRAEISRRQAALDQALENKQAAETGLKQIELKASQLQARFDQAARAAEEAAKANQSDLVGARTMVAQAERTIEELQASLKAVSHAEKAIAATLQAEKAQHQASIADYQSRLESQAAAGRKAAEVSAEKLQAAERIAQELKLRLVAMEQAREGVAERSERPRKAGENLQQSRSAWSEEAGVELCDEPSEPASGHDEQASLPPLLPNASAESPPEAVLDAPSAGIALAQASEEAAQAFPCETDPTSSPQVPAQPLVPPSTSPVNSAVLAPEVGNELPPATSSPPPVRAAKEQSPRPQRRRKVRSEAQIELFGDSTSDAPDEQLADPVPISAVAAFQSPEASQQATHTPVLEPPEPREASPGVPDPGTDDVTLPAEDFGTPEPELLPEWPLIEGLDTADGLSFARGDAELYLKALREFAEQQTAAPDRIQEALLESDLAAADQLVQGLQTAAGDMGAHIVCSASAALAKAIQSRSDPADVETLWAELEKVLRELINDLKVALRPKEERPAAAKRPTPPPAVDVAQLRRAVNEIFPLLADKDPGAKDCLKAHRAAFRAAFPAAGFAEFEQQVKRGTFEPALEHLRKVAKRHGIHV